MGDPSTRDMSKQDSWGRLYGTPVGVAELSKRPFERGTVGLAYRKDQTPIAAGSQFFILTPPNPQLNGKYTAIGRVTRGTRRRREAPGRRHDQVGEREMTRRRSFSWVVSVGVAVAAVGTWGVVGAREAQSAQAALAEPFKGVTTNGTVQPGLFRDQERAACRHGRCATRRPGSSPR